MKNLMLGFAMLFAAPTAAHAAEDKAPKACCCKEMKKDCCAGKKGEDAPDHGEHQDMQH